MTEKKTTKKPVKKPAKKPAAEIEQPVIKPVVPGDELDSLDDLEAEIEKNGAAIEGDVQTEADQKQKQDDRDEAAIAGASMAVGAAEALLQMWKGYIVLDPDLKEQLIEKGAPVVKKHDAGLPDWLLPYKEEIELGFVLVMGGAGIYAQILDHEASLNNGNDNGNKKESVNNVTNDTTKHEHVTS